MSMGRKYRENGLDGGAFWNKNWRAVRLASFWTQGQNSFQGIPISRASPCTQARKKCAKNTNGRGEPATRTNRG
jgi:hypothetical protein